MSLMYASNQDRLKVYREERNVEARYNANQQIALDKKLAEERGDFEQANELSNLAKNVFSKLTEDIPADIKQAVVETGLDILKNSIKNKNLDSLMKAVQRIPKEKLSKTEKVIVKDLKNSAVKKMINDGIYEVLALKLPEEQQTQRLADEILEIVGGSENKPIVESLIVKSRSSSVGSEASIGSVDSVGSNVPTVLTIDSFHPSVTARDDLDFADIEREMGNIPSKGKIRALEDIASNYGIKLIVRGPSGKRNYKLTEKNFKEQVLNQNA